MKVKNKSNKIIAIGTSSPILPDKVFELTKEQEKNPVVKCFIDKGFLTVIPDDFDKKKKEDPTKALAKKIKAMKEEEVLAKCAELKIETEGKELSELKNLLLEAMA